MLLSRWQKLRHSKLPNQPSRTKWINGSTSFSIQPVCSLVLTPKTAASDSQEDFPMYGMKAFFFLSINTHVFFFLMSIP